MKNDAIRVWLLGAALCALGACSQGEIPEIEGGPAPVYSDTPIIPSVAIAGSNVDVTGDTKAPIDGGTATTAALTLYLARNDQSSGAYAGYGSTALSATRAAAVGNTATALTFSSAQYYLAAGNTKLTGWYPQATSFSAGAVKWTLTGQEDVMTASEQEGSKTAAMPALAFAHKLSQVQIYVFAENAEAAASWGKVTGVQVTGQANGCTYTLSSGAPAGTVTFEGSAGAFTLYNNASGISAPVGDNTKAVLLGTVMIAPQSSASYALPLSVTSASVTGKTLSVTGARLASTAYKIYLKLTVKDISATATIGGWSTATPDSDVTLQ